MFAKKTLLTLSAGALLSAALPALADHDNGRHRNRVQERVIVERYPVVQTQMVQYRSESRGRLYLPTRSRSDWDSLQNWLQESPETVKRLGFNGALAANGWTRREYEEWARYDSWESKVRPVGEPPVHGF